MTMKKFVLVAALAFTFALAVAAQPADAGPFGRRGGYYGGGYYGMRGYYGGGYNSGYYSPYTYGYSGWTSPAWYAYNYPYSTYNYGWTSAYAYPYSTNYYTYGYPSYGINSYVAPASWDTSNPQYSQAARDLNTYRSFYSPSQGGTDAMIKVEVPDPNARVYFDDAPTRQMGTERVFTSPPLDANKSYTYTVRATWMENGREVNRSKDVKVQAGRTAMVDFRDLRENNEAIPNPREDRRELRDREKELNKDLNKLPKPIDKNRINPPDE
jgi:uncharacterized protein (TIGR03000 family)